MALQSLQGRDHGICVGKPMTGLFMSWRDNVIIERIWRTVKYEEVYLKAYQTTSEARTQLTQYIRFYNEMRGHQALNGQTPDSVYFNYPFAAKAA